MKPVCVLDPLTGVYWRYPGWEAPPPFIFIRETMAQRVLRKLGWPAP